MGLFSKKIGPVFLKEESDATEYIEKMTELSKKAKGDLKEEIEKQISIAQIGEYGEKNIIYELKHSDLDMYIMHDIYLEVNGVGAQIDFLIVTKKIIYVIECKNLYGDITVREDGAFIREFSYKGRKKQKEAIYSPITQNEHHLHVLKEYIKDGKISIVKFLTDKMFNHIFKSVIVLANPKTILKTPRNFSGTILRADQLVRYIEEQNRMSNIIEGSTKDIANTARSYLAGHIPNHTDYSKKYQELLQKVQEEEEKSPNKELQTNNTVNVQKRYCPKCGSELVIRVAKKGENVGKKFYGCSKFPKCWFTENIEE